MPLHIDLFFIFKISISIGHQIPIYLLNFFINLRAHVSVLARHYSDYSPEVLKEIYERADLKYFI